MTSTRSAPQHAGVRVPPAGRYRLDPARSSVTFRTRHVLGLGVVSGTMAVTSGETTIGPAAAQATVTAVVSAASFHTGNRVRDRDIRSARFLNAGRHPDITFGAATLSHDHDRWMLAGELAVRDVTRPVRLAIESVDAVSSGFRAQAHLGPVGDLTSLPGPAR